MPVLPGNPQTTPWLYLPSVSKRLATDPVSSPTLLGVYITHSDPFVFPSFSHRVLNHFKFLRAFCLLHLFLLMQCPKIYCILSLLYRTISFVLSNDHIKKKNHTTVRFLNNFLEIKSPKNHWKCMAIFLFTKLFASFTTINNYNTLLEVIMNKKNSSFHFVDEPFLFKYASKSDIVFQIRSTAYLVSAF